MDREISIGDYVLTGGEAAAMVVVDAVARLIPGVLGNEESARHESFAMGLLECPQYTRPEEFRGWKVPEVLLSGAPPGDRGLEAPRIAEAHTRAQARSSGDSGSYGEGSIVSRGSAKETLTHLRRPALCANGSFAVRAFF